MGRSDADILDVVETIYAAAGGNVPWPEALAKTASVCGGHAGVLHHYDLHDRRAKRCWESAFVGFDPSLLALYETHYAHVSPRAKIALTLPQGEIADSGASRPPIPT